MAKKPQSKAGEAMEQSTAEPAAPATGTSRVTSPDGGFRIPSPSLPEECDNADEVEAQPKKKAERTAGYLIIDSKHLVSTLAKSSEQTREFRLTALSRTNRDVAWLLSEYQKLSTKKQPTE